MAFTTTPEYLVISGSLRSSSRSRVMAEALREAYLALGVSNLLIDLREYVLPLCDAEVAYENPHVTTLTELIKAARIVVLATPIYNYDVNAALKNMIELTGGEAWENKTVGFLCAAGGAASYMSVMGLANSLMLDFRCLIIPRFVYAHGKDFIDAQLTPALAERIQALAAASIKIRNAL